MVDIAQRSFVFDWKNPDYSLILQWRWDRLKAMSQPRTGRPLVRALTVAYREHPANFINDWGLTADPRNAAVGRLVVVPFVLFPKQREWIAWFLRHMRERTPGMTEKSRDCGVSWLAMSTFVTLARFNDNMSFGVGSEKEDKVDRSGDPDTLFWKARFFFDNLPPHFRCAYDTAHMRMLITPTNSSITGEAGDNIGRGGRKTAYLLDESAHIDHGELIDQSLASNTNCRIDVSSVNGMNNSFAMKRHSGRIDVFSFSWLDDPRKDKAWYDKMAFELDAVTLEQEVNMNYKASTEGQIMPAEWVDAAIGAFEKLGLEPTGSKKSALDVADEGVDKNAYSYRHGVVLKRLKQWSGKGSDTYLTTVQAFFLCEEDGAEQLDYDADGLGAFVRGDVNKINEERLAEGRPTLFINAYRGSAAVEDPEGEMVHERKNKDYFANFNSQSWWSLRIRFQKTYRAVVDKMPFDPDELISIDPDLPDLALLRLELCQPTYTLNTAGKVVVDKAPTLPDGRKAKSPNLADTVKILYNPANYHLDVWRRLAKD